MGAGLAAAIGIAGGTTRSTSGLPSGRGCEARDGTVDARSVFILVRRIRIGSGHCLAVSTDLSIFVTHSRSRVTFSAALEVRATARVTAHKIVYPGKFEPNLDLEQTLIPGNFTGLRFAILTSMPDALRAVIALVAAEDVRRTSALPLIFLKTERPWTA